MEQEQKNLIVVAQAVARAWTDDDFKKDFVSSPRSVLENAGLEMPSEIQIVGHEDTDSLKHLILPNEPIGSYQSKLLTTLAADISNSPPETEFRLLRNTDTLRHVVVPIRPQGLSAEQITTQATAALAASADVATDVEVVQTEAAVTTTTAVSEAEVAEFALVAIAVVPALVS